MVRLDKLYKKDDLPNNLKIPEYISQFENGLNKVKTYGGDMSESVLAYRLLKNANLKQNSVVD